jgi:MSHA biogenesis protein MshE
VTPATEHWGWVPLGQMLVQDGILTDEQVATALERQRKTKERLGQVLIDMRLIDEEVLLKYLGAQFRKEPITRQELGALDLDVVKLIPEDVARQHRVVVPESASSPDMRRRIFACRRVHVVIDAHAT